MIKWQAIRWEVSVTSLTYGKLAHFLDYSMEKDPHPWGWSDERRARQSEMIHRWQPWTRSSGPKTPEGKAASPRNTPKPGSIKYELLTMKRQLADLMRAAKLVAARRRAGRAR
jgi:hypothetical protein